MITARAFLLLSLTAISFYSVSMEVRSQQKPFSFIDPYEPQDPIETITLLREKNIEQIKREAESGFVDAMFRYSAALFKQHKFQEGNFWYSAGIIRLKQDCNCYNFNNFNDVLKKIKGQFKPFIKSPIGSKNESHNFLKVFAYVVQMTEEQTLPAPSLIKQFSINKAARMFGINNTLLSPDTWNSKRLEVLQHYRENYFACLKKIS